MSERDAGVCCPHPEVLCHLACSPASDHVELMPWASPASPFASCRFRGCQADNLSPQPLKRLSNSSLKYTHTPQQWNGPPHSDWNFQCLNCFMCQMTAVAETHNRIWLALQLLVCHLPAEPSGWTFRTYTVWDVVCWFLGPGSPTFPRTQKKWKHLLTTKCHTAYGTVSFQWGNYFERIKHSACRDVIATG